jgi:hypothetical protein
MNEPHRAPFWKRKRWIAAGVVWLVIVPFVYPLSFGPLLYLNRRGWFQGETWLQLYAPINRFVSSDVRESTGYYTYLDWWAELGERQRANGK